MPDFVIASPKSLEKGKYNTVSVDTTDSLAKNPGIKEKVSRQVKQRGSINGCMALPSLPYIGFPYILIRA